jgi:hypothetical protein
MSDETWIHHYEPESKQQYGLEAFGFSTNKPSQNTAVTGQDHAYGILGRGPILCHYMEKGSTINSASCCEVLGKELKQAICMKHHGLLSEGVILQHDNARPT